MGGVRKQERVCAQTACSLKKAAGNAAIEQLNKESIEQEKSLKEKLIEVTKKIDTIEEKHYV
ncbi:hypothetical protein EON66_05330, partial [archaeon]